MYGDLQVCPMKGAKYTDTIDRLLAATKSKSDAKLAAALGIKPQSVSQAKKKNLVPAQWFVQISKKFGVSVDWLLAGLEGRATTNPKADPELCQQCIQLYARLDLVREREVTLLQDNYALKAENAELKALLSPPVKGAN